MAFVVFVLTILWFVYLTLAKNKISLSICTVASLKRTAVYGQFTSSYKFLGSHGINFLIDNYMSFLKGLTTTPLPTATRNAATSLRSLLPTLASSMTESYSGISKSMSDYTYIGADGLSNVYSPGLRALGDIVGNGLSKEADLLVNITESLRLGVSSLDWATTNFTNDEITARDIKFVVYNRVARPMVDLLYNHVEAKDNFSPGRFYDFMTAVPIVFGILIFGGIILLWIVLIVTSMVLTLLGLNLEHQEANRRAQQRKDKALENLLLGSKPDPNYYKAELSVDQRNQAQPNIASKYLVKAAPSHLNHQEQIKYKGDEMFLDEPDRMNESEKNQLAEERYDRLQKDFPESFDRKEQENNFTDKN